MAGGVQAGRKNFLYYNGNATGAYAAPLTDFVVIDRVGDVNMTNNKQETGVDMRASETTITVYGNKAREITFTYYKKKGAADVVFNKLKDSYENDTVLDIISLEDKITIAGTTGIRGPYVVSQMDKAEPIAGVDAFSMTLKFADADQVGVAPVTPFLFEPDFVVP